MNLIFFKSCSDYWFTLRKVLETPLGPMLPHPGSAPTRYSHCDNKELETEDLG